MFSFHNNHKLVFYTFDKLKRLAPFHKVNPLILLTPGTSRRCPGVGVRCFGQSVMYIDGYICIQYIDVYILA